MHLRLQILALLLTLGCALSSRAQLTATEAFTSAPRKVLPLLSENARLDMVDYFNSNFPNTTANNYGGRSRITSLDPQQLTAQLTDASQCQIAILPDGKQGLIAWISTVATPAPDSQMKVYSSDWNRDLTASTFTKPTLADWLTPEGKKHSDEVEMSVPFLLISYTYNPADRTLTLTNNAKEFLGEDAYEGVSAYIYPQITYRFDGKRFNRVK